MQFIIINNLSLFFLDFNSRRRLQILTDQYSQPLIDIQVNQNVLVYLFNHLGSSLTGRWSVVKQSCQLLGAGGIIQTHSEESTKARSDRVSEVCPECSSKQKQAHLSWKLHSEYYIVSGIVQCVFFLCVFCADRYGNVDKDPLILKENFTPH